MSHCARLSLLHLPGTRSRAIKPHSVDERARREDRMVYGLGLVFLVVVMLWVAVRLILDALGIMPL